MSDQLADDAELEARRQRTIDLLVAARLRLTTKRDATPGKPSAGFGYTYYAATAYSLLTVVTEHVPTVAVDRWFRLYANPWWVPEQTMDELCGVLTHEIHHVLRLHNERCPAADDQHRWNVAADLEINCDIAASNLPLPEGCLYPALFGYPDGLTAEEYYSRLEAEQPPPDPSCGDGADGKPRHWEVGPHTDTMGDDDGDSGKPGQAKASEVGGISESTASRIRHRTAEAVEEYEAKHPGSIPGGLQRWAANTLRPTIDWRQLLGAAIRGGVASRAGKADWTWKRPSRRGQIGGVVRPSLAAPDPRVGVVIDTSGSMSSTDLTEALNEVAGIIRAGGGHCQVLCCDASAADAQTVTDPRDIVLIGGGGTDMGAGIEAAAELRPSPSCIVVITDGYTGWPDEPPDGIDVVVVITRSGAKVDGPRWATTVRVQDAA